MPSAQAYTLSRRLQEELHEAREYLRNLPSLTLVEIPEEEYCPICFNSLASIIVEYAGVPRSENADGNTGCSVCSDDESDTICKHGVVRLESCGHIFCRMDLLEWIDSLHGTCPTCRTIFFPFTQYSEADLESSDGGEYLPEEDEVDMDEEDDFEEEEDGFDEVDYDAFPDFEIDNELEPEDGTRQAGNQWRQVINAMSGARSGVFRAAREVMSEEGMNMADEGEQDTEDDWMDEDTALSSSAGEMTEGSDGPTSDELSSNISDADDRDDDDAEVCEVDAALAICEPRKDGNTTTHPETCSREEGQAESHSQH